MRWQIAAALALVCTVAVPSLPAQGGGTVVDAFESGALQVDLVDDAGTALAFRLDEGNFGDGSPLQSAFVRLSKAGEPSTDLAMQRSGTVWSVGLSVSTPDLVAGAWTVDFYGVRPAGGSLLASRTLDITANDRIPPRLFLASAASPILVGPGDSIALLVSDPLLRRVTYQFGGLPEPLPLAHPYALRADILPEGDVEVTFRASDRAGHVSTLVVDVEHDTFVPKVDLLLPEHAYLGGELDVTAVVREDGPFTLRLDVNGTKDEVKVTGKTATNVNRTTVFTLIPLEGTELTLSVEAIDRVGNRGIALRNIALLPPIVDARAVSLLVESPGPVTVRDTVRLVATVEQVDGVATLPLSVTISAGSASATFVSSVEPGASASVVWETRLPAGRHQAVAIVAAPATANETNPGNEEVVIEVEVFLGRLSADGKHYDIRASDQGLPMAAVEAGSTRTFPLKLVDQGAGVAYEFKAGNNTYVWDPLEPMQDLGSEPTETATQTGGSNAAPFPGLVMVLLVLVLALAQRRRWP